MVIAQATRIRMILRKTPLKVYSNLNKNVFFLSASSHTVKRFMVNVKVLKIKCGHWKMSKWPSLVFKLFSSGSTS